MRKPDNQTTRRSEQRSSGLILSKKPVYAGFEILPDLVRNYPPWILNRFSQENIVDTSSKLNCYDVFRAQGWRVVPLIRLARLAVRLAQVCECSFNHTTEPEFWPWDLSLLYNFFSLSQSPLTVIAGLILLLKHPMRFVAAGSAFYTCAPVCVLFFHHSKVYSVIQLQVLKFKSGLSAAYLIQGIAYFLQGNVR